MKIIQVNFENSTPVIVQDNDESLIAEYSKNLSNILDNTNISILHTSEGSLIIRPDRVVSIFISNVNQPEQVEKITKPRGPKKKIEKSLEPITVPPIAEEQDIIKD